MSRATVLCVPLQGGGFHAVCVGSERIGPECWAATEKEAAEAALRGYVESPRKKTIWDIQRFGTTRVPWDRKAGRS